MRTYLWYPLKSLILPYHQTMFRAASLLLEDLSSHSRLLSSPERAQVLLAAFQHPLLTDYSFAKMLVPRLGTIFMNAPVPTRQVGTSKQTLSKHSLNVGGDLIVRSIRMQLLVKWWSECSGPILLERVVKPLQAFLTKVRGCPIVISREFHSQDCGHDFLFFIQS